MQNRATSPDSESRTPCEHCGYKGRGWYVTRQKEVPLADDAGVLLSPVFACPKCDREASE
jgi:hypothetical protein